MNMRSLATILFFFFSFFAIGQGEDAWIYFTDKPQAQYYLANPLEMLSQKSLDRRTARGIAPDEKDVPVHHQYISQIAAADGIVVLARSKWLNAVHVRGSAENINLLAAFIFVKKIDFADKALNSSGRPVNLKKTAKVSRVAGQAISYNYGTSATQVEMLNGHALHQQDFTGTGITIAVLDSGFPGVDIAQPFERLRDNNKILGGYNFVSRSPDVYSGNNHGTLVLSTMGGYAEGQLVGTAPDAFYYLFVTEDVSAENPLEESLWVEAAEVADSLGVDIINTSLGYFNYDNPAYSYSYEDMDGQTAFITRGANVAFTRGVLCVTSAGNTANTANPNIGVPADAYNTLTVGAVNNQEQYVSFSSVGPSFDGRVKPDVMAQGAASVVSGPQGSIATANGTSFSGPITAGLVACLWQALPDKTNAEILQLVKESADRYANPNAQYGYGIPDFALALQKGAEMTGAEKFSLYPNPSDGFAALAFPDGTETARITVFNNLGQLVMEKLVSRANPEFSTTALATGIYSYMIESKQGSSRGRLVKK